MTLAAIDLGTNSFRLLVARQEGGRLVAVRKELSTTRLGEGLNQSGMIGDAAIERSIDCLRWYSAIMSEEGVEAYRAVATSALREAANQKEYINTIESICHMPIEIISGDEEARLSYTGVSRGMEWVSPPLVADLGGGSTEFICLSSSLDIAMSLPLGAVRATEANYGSKEIQSILAPMQPFQSDLAGSPLVFVGGTATSLTAVKLGLKVYKRELVHGQVLTRMDLEDLYQRLNSVSLEERRRIPGLQPERADIIVKGALIVKEIMDFMQRDRIIISESDILEGIIYGLAGV